MVPFLVQKFSLPLIIVKYHHFQVCTVVTLHSKLSIHIVVPYSLRQHRQIVADCYPHIGTINTHPRHVIQLLGADLIVTGRPCSSSGRQTAGIFTWADRSVVSSQISLQYANQQRLQPITICSKCTAYKHAYLPHFIACCKTDSSFTAYV